MTVDIAVDHDVQLDGLNIPPCAECDGNPADTTARGVCTECGAGTCRTCDGEGVEYERTGIDSERAVACSACGDHDRFDDRVDGDARYDAMRDDQLTDTDGFRDARL